MQKLDLSVALIRRNEKETMRWLARSKPNRSLFSFVIADRLGKESFRETAIREVAWELGLNRHRDFLVSNMAQMNLEFVDQLPGQFDKTHVVVSFYNVEIYRSEVTKRLQKDPRNHWVTSEEICAGVSNEGVLFDPVVPYLINRSHVIQNWESFSRRDSL